MNSFIKGLARDSNEDFFGIADFFDTEDFYYVVEVRDADTLAGDAI